MTGENLNRRYHELCGWTIKKATSGKGITWFYLVRPDKGLCGNSMPDHLAWAGLPKLHLDANLAIAEADRVFLFDGQPRYQLIMEDGLWYIKAPQQPTGKGNASLCEAILAALIKARQQ